MTRRRTSLIFTLVACLLIAAPGAAQDKATPEEIVDKIEKAAEFLSKSGEAGLAAFNDPDGQWVWKDTYVFVYECEKGVMVAHPLKHNLLGKKLTGLKDIKGNLLYVQLCEAAKAPKGGWAEYWWPKPGEKKPSRKISLIRQAPNTPYQVAAGIYDDNASIADLQKLIK